MKNGGATELGHVGEQRHAFHAGGELAEHLGRVEGLGKDRVGPGLHVEPGACHRAVHALAGRGVGAGDHHQMATRAGGGGDLGGHVRRLGELLVVEVAALLRQQLVLDMHRRRTRVFKGADHVHDVERFAIAGIAVDQQRQAGGTGDLAHEEAHLVDGDHAEIGDAHRRRHRRAGEIQRFEPGGLCL